jgi:predicted GH43/DUF377 family glycosyl hydrolase
LADSLVTTPYIERQSLFFRADPTRVILRPFKPAPEPRDHNPTDRARVNHIVDKILGLDAEATHRLLAEVLESFQDRHRGLVQLCEARAAELEAVLTPHPGFNREQRRLVGAYFLQEYSYESSALFNPSVVPHPDQSGLAPGSLRLIFSLRAVGEGHISSLTFRTGEVDAMGRLSLEPAGRLACLPRVGSRGCGQGRDGVEVSFAPDVALSERVIFPVTESQSNGIEDVRFVAFKEAGATTYYATFTAYSGYAIRSELIETKDFVSFCLTPLRGTAARAKGMALFPRKIDGRFVMIGRQDSENLYLIFSNDLCFWGEGAPLLRPRFPWEFIQIGNCGSPIELDEGWLLLTHGVGPLRKYCIGATLLDRFDPSKVIARSRYPIIRPDPPEREGYVPNVVYTCGALLHGARLLIPYAVSDTFCTFGSVPVSALLESLEPTSSPSGRL